MFVKCFFFFKNHHAGVAKLDTFWRCDFKQLVLFWSSIRFWLLLVAEWDGYSGFGDLQYCGEMGWNRQVEEGFSSFFFIFDYFRKFCSAFDMLHFGKKLAKNEEKPCSTCLQVISPSTAATWDPDIGYSFHHKLLHLLKESWHLHTLRSPFLRSQVKCSRNNNCTTFARWNILTLWAKQLY